jgi:hypothetical protein
MTLSLWARTVPPSKGVLPCPSGLSFRPLCLLVCLWQMSWWSSYKQGKVDKIVSFARDARSGEYTTTHTCTSTALTDTELATALTE